MDGNAVADMGLSAKEVAELVAASSWVMDKAYAAILERGKFSWDQLWNAKRTPWINCNRHDIAGIWVAYSKSASNIVVDRPRPDGQLLPAVQVRGRHPQALQARLYGTKV